MSRFLIIFFALVIVACKIDTPVKSKIHAKAKSNSYEKNVKGLVSIKTYNLYNQEIGKGFGFYIDKKTVVANLDLISGCFKAKVAPLGADDYYDVVGYSAISHTDNLVLLSTLFTKKDYLRIDLRVEPGDSLYSLYRKDRKLYVRKLKSGSILKTDSTEMNQLYGKVVAGEAVFNTNDKLVGIVQNRKVRDSTFKCFVGVEKISVLAKKQITLKSLNELSLERNKVYPSHTGIRGFRVKTTMGNIDIRLFDQTPEYRDNFIRLVSDDFYDSLLVHRVINDFLIQTGAADTKHAKRNDMVGWQGPGYTLPIKIVRGLFHKRGAIAASKLPGDRNPRNRCDGSQFYIVSGRVFSNIELDDLEKSKGIKYTDEQRKIYTTVGGAPYLDGDYTVFGEVISGMSLVDAISKIDTYNGDRPIKDVRIRDIEILWK